MLLAHTETKTYITSPFNQVFEIVAVLTICNINSKCYGGLKRPTSGDIADSVTTSSQQQQWQVVLFHEFNRFGMSCKSNQCIMIQIQVNKECTTTSGHLELPPPYCIKYCKCTNSHDQKILMEYKLIQATFQDELSSTLRLAILKWITGELFQM